MTTSNENNNLEALLSNDPEGTERDKLMRILQDLEQELENKMKRGCTQDEYKAGQRSGERGAGRAGGVTGLPCTSEQQLNNMPVSLDRFSAIAARQDARDSGIVRLDSREDLRLNQSRFRLGALGA